MAGFQHDIAGGQGDLIVTQLQSPNFSLAGETGWAILKNGNAYFFDVTAEGTITASAFDGTDFIISSSGIFFYSGTPGAGNLIASITPAGGTDGFGNAYAGGITAYSGANVWASVTAGTVSMQGASGQYQTGQLGASGSGTTFLSSGLETNTDTGGEVIVQSADAAGGQTTITLSAAEVEATGSLAVSANLTIGGVNIVVALSGQPTTTNGLFDGTISGTSTSAGLTNGQIAGTSGGASAGTAHTHGAGSYAVTNGQHTHSPGSYAVTNGTHSHDLPTF